MVVGGGGEAGAASEEHGWVDVADNDVGSGVVLEEGGVVEEAEGDVAGSARDV